MITAPSTTALRLSVMMFLQFFVWGAWFATLGQVLGANGLDAFGGGAYGTAPLAAIIAPLFLGLVADRFFPSQIVMGILFLVGGGFMFAVHGAASAGNGSLMVWFMTGHMLCYMPTLGLGNTIAFTHLKLEDFPKVRVWGTIGWIVAGLTAAYFGWTSSFNLFLLAGGSAVALGLFCFILPHTPAPAKGKPINLQSLLMVDAWRLFKKTPFMVFALCSLLICIPLAYYYGLTSMFLTNTGAHQAAATMTIGQMSEIFFMLLVPFFFRRLGVKWMILIGMMAWVVRYLLFAMGAPDQVFWMLLLGVALHGICYDFFFVVGFMYTERTAPAEARGQAQGLLVFLTQGVGMYIGYMVAFGRFNKSVTDYGPLNQAIMDARPEETLTAFQALGRMFKFGLPEGIPSDLLESAMAQWKQFWMLPAFMALAITVVFFLAFWDRSKGSPDAVELAKAASPDEQSAP